METTTYSPMQRFWRLIKPDGKEVRNIYVYAFFYGLVNLSLPIGIQAIINLIQGGQVSTSLIMLIAFVILGVIITGVLQVHQLKVTEHLQQKIFARAAFEFAFRIPRIKFEELYRRYAPELMNRFFDIVAIQKGLSKILMDFTTASIQTVFGLLLLSLYHPFFIAFSLILVLLLFALFKLTVSRGLITSLKESKNKYDLAHWLQELARTITGFKLAGETDLPLEKTNQSVDEYLDARDSHFRILLNQYYLLIFFKVLVASGLLIAGSILVIEQQMNIGQFVAAEIIILMVLGSVEKLILSLETIYDVLTSLEKVGQVTDLELEEDAGIDFQANNGKDNLCVELSHVSFKYPGTDKFIFDNASLRIEPGEKVMIYGEGTSGKSTLLYLLGGLYKLNAGTLSFNDIPYGNLNPNKLRSIIGDCLMDDLLFEGTILENITMGRERASFENVRWAVKNLGLEDFIKALPQGFETMIHPNGKQFSKGVVDKLLLARSIVDRPKLLLIKDSFKSLVGREKRNIFEFLTSPENNWTLVVATKDQSLGNLMDRQITTENGLLTESKL